MMKKAKMMKAGKPAVKMQLRIGPMIGCRRTVIEVNDLVEAADHYLALKRERAEQGFLTGARDFPNGRVYRGGHKIATILYNGTIDAGLT